MFIGQKINLSKHPMHPRPETEYWVSKFIESIGTEIKNPFHVLDLFTGSGCIGIAVASACPKSQVLLSDKTNYISTSLPKNTKFIQSDLFSKIPDKFDYILANPPYVPEGKGMKGIMDHEPHDALYAGKDGLDVIKPFLEQARDRLNPSGQIWLEFGTEQKEAITNILRELNYYQSFNISFHKNQHDKWRYLVAKL